MDARYTFNPPRPLSDRERETTRWVIENGDAPRMDKHTFLAQLDAATVESRCPCGCASVQFSIRGYEKPKAKGLVKIGDFVAGDDDENRCGVFVYSISGILAGIEIYPLSEKSVFNEFPAIKAFRPFDEVKST